MDNRKEVDVSRCTHKNDKEIMTITLLKRGMCRCNTCNVTFSLMPNLGPEDVHDMRNQLLILSKDDDEVDDILNEGDDVIRYLFRKRKEKHEKRMNRGKK